MLRSRTRILSPVAVCCKRTIEVGYILYIIFTAMDSIKLTMSMKLNPNDKKGGTMNHHKAFPGKIQVLCPVHVPISIGTAAHGPC